MKNNTRNIGMFKVSEPLLREMFQIGSDVRIIDIRFDSFTNTVSFLLEGDELFKTATGCMPYTVSFDYVKQGDQEVGSIIWPWTDK